jgi:hypothetical protein
MSRRSSASARRNVPVAEWRKRMLDMERRDFIALLGGGLAVPDKLIALADEVIE